MRSGARRGPRGCSCARRTRQLPPAATHEPEAAASRAAGGPWPLSAPCYSQRCAVGEYRAAGHRHKCEAAADVGRAAVAIHDELRARDAERGAGDGVRQPVIVVLQALVTVMAPSP